MTTPAAPKREPALPVPEDLLRLYRDAAQALLPRLQQSTGTDATIPLLHLAQVGEELTRRLPGLDMPNEDRPGLAFALGALLTIWLLANSRLNPRPFLAPTATPPNFQGFPGLAGAAGPLPFRPSAPPTGALFTPTKTQAAANNRLQRLLRGDASAIPQPRPLP